MKNDKAYITSNQQTKNTLKLLIYNQILKNIKMMYCYLKYICVHDSGLPKNK